jgi:ArsR family transcriptional regulator
MIQTIDILNGLANQSRLHLFLTLLERDFCVCELQRILNQSQSCLSHQLRLLKFYGLVEARQEGHWIVYSVAGEVRKNQIIQAIKGHTELPASISKKIPHVRMREKR